MRNCLYCNYISPREFFRCPRCKELNTMTLGREETQQSVNQMLMGRPSVQKVRQAIKSSRTKSTEVREARLSRPNCPKCERGVITEHIVRGVRTHSTCARCGYFMLGSLKNMFTLNNRQPLRLCPDGCGGYMFHIENKNPYEPILRCEGCGSTLLYNLRSYKIVYLGKKKIMAKPKKLAVKRAPLSPSAQFVDIGMGMKVRETRKCGNCGRRMKISGVEDAANRRDKIVVYRCEECDSMYNDRVRPSMTPFQIPKKVDRRTPSIEYEDIGWGVKALKERPCECGGIMTIYHVEDAVRGSAGPNGKVVIYKCRSCFRVYKHLTSVTDNMLRAEPEHVTREEARTTVRKYHNNPTSVILESGATLKKKILCDDCGSNSLKLMGWEDNQFAEYECSNCGRTVTFEIIDGELVNL